MENSSTNSMQLIESNTQLYQLPENSIFNEDKFPPIHKNQPATPHCSPKTVYQALMEYARATTPLNKICEDKKIRWVTFWQLEDNFPEVRNMYVWARERKSKVMAESAQALYEEEPPETCYQIDKYGNRQLSMAGIRWLENKANMRMRMAEIAETGRINSKHEIEINQRVMSTNVNVNINTDIADPSQLIDAINGLSSR